MRIKENILQINKIISHDVKILAATKSRSIEEIKQAISMGIKMIGENYVQEAIEKSWSMKGLAELHCIGHLQKNKVKVAVEIFDMIDTIDSVEIALEINKRCEQINKIMPVLIEVNIAKEENKHGCIPEHLIELADSLAGLKNIRLRGLMTLGPNISAEKLRLYFREMKILFDKLKHKYPQIDILSMGMSDSYIIAVQEGATMIRLGTAIFGN
jgi:hypothetical protein